MHVECIDRRIDGYRIQFRMSILTYKVHFCYAALLSHDNDMTVRSIRPSICPAKQRPGQEIKSNVVGRNYKDIKRSLMYPKPCSLALNTVPCCAHPGYHLLARAIQDDVIKRRWGNKRKEKKEITPAMLRWRLRKTVAASDRRGDREISRGRNPDMQPIYIYAPRRVPHSSGSMLRSGTSQASRRNREWAALA